MTQTESISRRDFLKLSGVGLMAFMSPPELGIVFPDTSLPMFIEPALGVPYPISLNALESSIVSYTVPEHTTLHDVLTPDALAQLKNALSRRNIDPAKYTLSTDSGAVYNAALARHNANAFSDALWYMKSSEDSTFNPDLPSTEAILGLVDRNVSFSQLSVMRSAQNDQPTICLYETNGDVSLNVIYPDTDHILDHVGIAGNGIVIVYERNVHDDSTLSYYATVNAKGIRRIPWSEVRQSRERQSDPWDSLQIRLQRFSSSQDVVRIAPGGDVVRVTYNPETLQTGIAVWDRDAFQFTREVRTTRLPLNASSEISTAILTMNGSLVLLETNTDAPQITVINQKSLTVTKTPLNNKIASGRSISETPYFYTRGIETSYPEFSIDGSSGLVTPEHSLWMMGPDGGYIPWIQFYLQEDSELLIMENTSEEDFILPPVPQYETPPPSLRKVYA